MWYHPDTAKLLDAAKAEPDIIATAAKHIFGGRSARKDVFEITQEKSLDRQKELA